MIQEDKTYYLNLLDGSIFYEYDLILMKIIIKNINNDKTYKPSLDATALAEKFYVRISSIEETFSSYSEGEELELVNKDLEHIHSSFSEAQHDLVNSIFNWPRDLR